jgi:hypothetical protein
MSQLTCLNPLSRRREIVAFTTPTAGSQQPGAVAALTESEARKVILVRAIELAEPTLNTWSKDQRQWASDVASEAGRDGASSHAAGTAFLARRADVACARLEREHHEIALARRGGVWPQWMHWLVPVAAFALGFAANELAAGDRVNIISFPLLAMLAWNMVVYLTLIVSAFRNTVRPRANTRQAPLVRVFARAWYRRHSSAAGALAAPLRQFANDWMLAAEQLYRARARAMLHAAAGLLAAGAVAGLYVRGLALEYRAGWESTFLDAQAVHHLLAFVLGPASWLSGIELPGPADLAFLHWPDGHENAARWIHLYAISAALFIIVPRFVLATSSAISAGRLKRDFPLPLTSDPYFVRLLSGASGKAVVIDVVPYSYRPDAAARAALLEALASLAGSRVDVRFAEPVPYGGEDDAVECISSVGTAPDYVIVLFNIAATPEDENHGEFAASVVRRAGPQTRVGIVLDASAYRQRLEGLARIDERLAERRRSWETMLLSRGIEAVALSSTPEASQTIAARLDASIASTRMALART